MFFCDRYATVDKAKGNRGKVWGKLPVFSGSWKAFVYTTPLASPSFPSFTIKKNPTKS
jgi:hypothetical protein